MLYKALNNFYIKYLLAIFSIVGGYLFLFLFDRFNNHQHITLCIFKLTTGIPCPGCGMGRATIELIRGNFAEAYHYNILSIPFSVLVIITFIWMIIDLITSRDTFFNFIGKEMKLSYKVLIVMVLIMDWLVNIIRGV
ncbi:MAG: DUF2752 domain-containing protein [Sporocytophaga sp.]|nr:DUF2752 domain-containing protein [Sporocytophaga sp.]